MALEIQLVQPSPPRRYLHHALGLAILAINSLRHRIQSYSTPRPWVERDTERILEHDRQVLDRWRAHLEHYLRFELDLSTCDILELQPGSDLGTGLLWLAAGARSYTAADTHPLVHKSSLALHEELVEKICAESEDESLRSKLSEAVEKLFSDEDGPLRYRILPGLNFDRLDVDGFDLVVSHSALEHIRDIPATLLKLSDKISDRAHLVADIDLQTHTRWIKDLDPLNIYRFSHRVYRALGYDGMPNRLRPDEYLEALEKAGWVDLKIYPRKVLSPEYVAAAEPGLHRTFQGDPEHLGWLNLVMCGSRMGKRSWKEPNE